jgi:hypothetical protein
MVFRAINLKLILRRDESGRELRQALWQTHSVINEAVAEIERILLLCRGRGYRFGDDEIRTAEEVQRDAIQFAREVQATNGRPALGRDDEMLQALSQLYETLVPSVLLDDHGDPLDGDAQKSGGLCSPLMDPDSAGMQDVFRKTLAQMPGWVAQMDQADSGWEAESAAWLTSDEGRVLQEIKGRRPAWIKNALAGLPWQQEFIADQERKRKQTQGDALVVRRLREELGLLPLMKPPVSSRFADWKGGLKPWDRLAMRLAVAHLLSWESWNHRAAREHLKVQQQVERQQAELDRWPEAIKALRAYERERHELLKRSTLATDDRPYTVGMRAIRGWDRVRDAWRQGGDQTRRMERLAELQTQLRGKFGDPELFRWLSASGRETLWQEIDPLPALARFNALERLLARKKAWTRSTAPDARLHPRWTAYEPQGGSNLRNYDLQIDEGGVRLRVPLMHGANGGLAEREFVIPLAPSNQFEEPAWQETGDRKTRRITFRTSYQTFSAANRDSEILLARRQLENRRPEELAAGDIGSVWLKLVLDVDPLAPPEWLDNQGRVKTPAVVHHFKTALANTSKHVAAVEPGLRVLAVDLGLRSFATCSVFELVQDKPATGLTFLADLDRNLWARHERSFVLSLPGESPTTAQSAARQLANSELAAFRREMNHLRGLLRLQTADDAERRMELLNDLRQQLEELETQARSAKLPIAAIRGLEDHVGDSGPIWEHEVREVYRRTEHEVGLAFHSWRSATRPRQERDASTFEHRAYAPGKSAWSVEYLERLRRLLVGWSLRGRQFGAINRANRSRQGTYAAQLLAHINGLKKDRTKAGADLIIQSARGYIPAGKRGWRKAFEPCRLILFEDLARYRFRTDRPRRENSLLMRWTHREIVREATLQAAVFGMVVETTGAGFTSRFHARTGAPGCRTRLITEADFQSPRLREEILQLVGRLGLADLEMLRPGLRIPWDGGPEFATLDAQGKLVLLQADINAAQNLQRRFWTRHADAIRLSAVEVRQGGAAWWFPDQEGVRVRGALMQLVGGAGYARLVTRDNGFHLEGISKRQWQNAVQGQTQEETALDDVELEIAAALEDGEFERGSGRMTFFRDPSGNVLSSDLWYEAPVFWSVVQRKIAAALWDQSQ